jgi:hypothetical protein
MATLVGLGPHAARAYSLVSDNLGRHSSRLKDIDIFRSSAEDKDDYKY